MANIIRLRAFVDAPETIRLLIGTINCFPLHADSDDELESYQVRYRPSGRKGRCNGHDWISATSGSGTSTYLYPIQPNQQYQVLVLYRTHSQGQFKQLFHFSSPQVLIIDAKVKIFNNTPNSSNQAANSLHQDLQLVDYIVAVLFKQAASIIERCDPPLDAFSIEPLITEWGTDLLEKVVQNQELADKKIIVVRAIIQSMLNILEQHQQPDQDGNSDPEQPRLRERLQTMFEKCFKAEHKRSGRASHVLRMLKHFARELFQTEDSNNCCNHGMNHRNDAQLRTNSNM